MWGVQGDGGEVRGQVVFAMVYLKFWLKDDRRGKGVATDVGGNEMVVGGGGETGRLDSTLDEDPTRTKSFERENSPPPDFVEDAFPKESELLVSGVLQVSTKLVSSLLSLRARIRVGRAMRNSNRILNGFTALGEFFFLVSGFTAPLG